MENNEFDNEVTGSNVQGRDGRLISQIKAIVDTKVPASDVPAVTEAAPLMAINTESGLEAYVRNAENYLKMQSRIRQLAINVTNNDDWIDQDGHPYLEYTGASKIASAFKPSFTNIKTEKEKITDDRGEYIIYTCRGVIHWDNRSMECIGTGSTRDPFFGRKNKQDIPLCEIDLTDVEKKAWTNFMNRATKALLGLSYTWEEIELASGGKIKRDGVSNIKHEKGGKGADSEGTKEKRDQLREKILAHCNNNMIEAKTWLVAHTEFTTKDGKNVAGKQSVQDISEKQVQYLLDNFDRLAKESKKDNKEPQGEK